MERRKFLLTTAVVPFVGLVSLTRGVRGNTDNPEDVVRLWYDAVDKQNPEMAEFALHSESDLSLKDVTRETDEEGEEGEAELTADTMVRVESTELLEEGLDESELSGRLLWNDIDDEAISELAASETAVVRAEVSYERLGEQQTEENEHVVVVEDGGWQVVNQRRQ
jgi:hypothetical protein